MKSANIPSPAKRRVAWALATERTAVHNPHATRYCAGIPTLCAKETSTRSQIAVAALRMCADWPLGQKQGCSQSGWINVNTSLLTTQI